MIHDVETLEEFKSILEKAGDKLVVVDFWATWCGPCKQIGPVFLQLSELPDNKDVIFLRVDVDETDEVSTYCQISCMPTFHFYKNGTKVFDFSGANEKTLVEKLKELK